MNLLNCSGRAAHQTVFHFHVHVVPRYGRPGDPPVGRGALALPWPTGGDGGIDEAAMLLAG